MNNEIITVRNGFDDSLLFVDIIALQVVGCVKADNKSFLARHRDEKGMYTRRFMNRALAEQFAETGEPRIIPTP